MDRLDWLYIGGVVLIAIGAGGFYWQLGPVVFGAGLIVMALLGARGGGIDAGKGE